jgi:hypothetical protein
MLAGTQPGISSRPVRLRTTVAPSTLHIDFMGERARLHLGEGHDPGAKNCEWCKVRAALCDQ